MAIVNITPDSFYDGGKNSSEIAILKNCEKHLLEGASMLDIGGQSTRPGAEQIGSEKEAHRVIPVIKAIKKEFPAAIISIDTYHSSVAHKSIDSGATIINDISAGSLDPNMLKTVLNFNVPYIASHIQGTPETMQNNPQYNNVVSELYHSLSKIKTELFKNGLNDLLVDPGFGFGKTSAQNFELLNNLDHFRSLDLPIVVGISRKSMIWKTLNVSPQESLNGTTSLNTIALLKGANILRVHDVKEAIETIQLVNQL